MNIMDALRRVTSALKNWVSEQITAAVPSCTADDNGKFLRVVNGAATWQTVQNAETDIDTVVNAVLEALPTWNGGSY